MVNIATQGPDGIAFRSEIANLTADEALSRGDIVELPLASEKFDSCSKVDVGDVGVGVLVGVALEDISSGSRGQIGLRGVFECAVDTEVQAVSVGLRVSRDHAGRLDLLPVPADDNVLASKCVGITLDANGSRADGDLATVLFAGITGFASQGTAES